MKRPEAGSLVWVFLIVPLLAVLVVTLASDRAARPPDVGEEPTFALQASSLAWDFDLQYSEEDYRRYVDQWGGRPGGLDLESRDGGQTQVYARPFYHALVAAPFVRAMPQRGMRVANALLLAVAALMTAWSLRRHFGPDAPLWVAVLVFASVTFSYVFLATADVFLVAVTAAGFALVYSGEREEALPQVYEGSRIWSWATFGRWLAIGMLLAIPGAYRPPYLLLLLAAAVALHGSVERRRSAAGAGLALGAAALLTVTVLIHTAAGGDPLWPLAGMSPALDPRLLLWNGVYFLVGRNVGLLPCFLPVLLALYAFRSNQGRWALLLGAGLAALAFLVLRPYDFAGAGGSVGNRLFLPLYAALWFLPARPLRMVPAAIIALLAVPFLFPLWMHPATPEGIPERIAVFLPYEATQQDLPGAWTLHDGLRIKPVSQSLWRAERGSDLRVAGAESGNLVAASPEALDGLVFDFDRNAPTRLLANGQDLRPAMLRADGSVSFLVPLGAGRVHPMWWTGEPYHLYSVRFRLPEAPAKPIGFRVRADRDLIEKVREGR